MITAHMDKGRRPAKHRNSDGCSFCNIQEKLQNTMTNTRKIKSPRDPGISWLDIYSSHYLNDGACGVRTPTIPTTRRQWAWIAGWSTNKKVEDEGVEANYHEERIEKKRTNSQRERRPSLREWLVARQLMDLRRPAMATVCHRHQRQQRPRQPMTTILAAWDLCRRLDRPRPAMARILAA